MKCRKCGFVFDEGIFCPECGEKNAENIPSEQTPENQEELLKKQEQLIEQEKNNLLLKKELEEQTERVKKEETERLVREKETITAQKELELQNLEKEKISITQRTYAGVTYRTEEEAIIAREDHEKVDIIKNRLLSTRKQSVRKEICDNFAETLTNPMAKQRFDMLKEKANKKMPIGILLNWIFDGISLGVGLILFIILIVLICIAPDADITMIICLIWGLLCMITLPIAVVWTIISIILMNRKGYYRKIKHI